MSSLHECQYDHSCDMNSSATFSYVSGTFGVDFGLYCLYIQTIYHWHNLHFPYDDIADEFITRLSVQEERKYRLQMLRYLQYDDGYKSCVGDPQIALTTNATNHDSQLHKYMKAPWRLKQMKYNNLIYKNKGHNNEYTKRRAFVGRSAAGSSNFVIIHPPLFLLLHLIIHSAACCLFLVPCSTCSGKRYVVKSSKKEVFYLWMIGAVVGVFL